MNRLVLILCCTVLAVSLLWFFPLFHIERLDAPKSHEVAQTTNSVESAAKFWKEQILPSLDQAPNGEEVISALRNNPLLARTKYGRKVGVSRTTLFMVQCKGTVATIDKKGVGVAFEESSARPDILLQTGLLFGNTVRDATGLLDASDFQDSRQFNEISTELNRLIEMQVMTKLKENATQGRRIQFVGCFELPDQGELGNPLSIIPMQVSFEPMGPTSLPSDEK